MQERRLRNGDGRQATIEAPAGVGISEHLRALKHRWEQAGHWVCGTNLAWQAARVLHGASGIRCQALVSLEADIHTGPATGWAADPLTGKDVVVNDKGIGRRRKAKLLMLAREAGARLVLGRNLGQ